MENWENYSTYTSYEEHVETYSFIRTLMFSSDVICVFFVAICGSIVERRILKLLNTNIFVEVAIVVSRRWALHSIDSSSRATGSAYRKRCRPEMARTTGSPTVNFGRAPAGYGVSTVFRFQLLIVTFSFHPIHLSCEAAFF